MNLRKAWGVGELGSWEVGKSVHLPNFPTPQVTNLGNAFLEVSSPPEPPLRNQGARIREADAYSGRGDSACDGGQGRPCLRHDWQRKDGRVPAADPPEADCEAARQNARAHPHADSRARRADR